VIDPNDFCDIFSFAYHRLSQFLSLFIHLFESESYLTSENLNIALAIDLSYSTYEKTFSSTNPVGDLNNDGKANTILDAQVAAIQDLLTNIGESGGLRNDNCEIELISFATDAQSHGVWQPLSNSNDSFNSQLMDYIKSQLRAPTSGSDVFQTNNGFTNFDAALDVAVEYFQNTATPNRKNLLVFLSDGEPNVRGDGDNEGYCSETTIFWNGDDTVLQCSDLGLAPGQRHEICRANDPNCAEFEPYQDCVRGPNECMNGPAVTQYDSEINALVEMNVERLAIGVGNESNVAWGSALWIIDNNPAKYLGVLPLQALTLEELTEYLSSLCILNTDPPTRSPSDSPSDFPTVSLAPSSSPSIAPSHSPTVSSQPSSILCYDPLDVSSSGVSRLLEGNATEGRYGLMKMCVRSSLGYTVDGLFREVNFIESLISIRYNLEAGFCVDAFSVEPKDRLETTKDKAFELDAYICDLGVNETLSNPTRTRPARITEYDYDENNPFPPGYSAYNQGALITVCVAPNAGAYSDGVRMDGLTSFTWTRDDVAITQPAIVDGAPAVNSLTLYDPSQCVGGYDYCHFSSILYADFYLSRGAVAGVGTADLAIVPVGTSPLLPTRRRLETDDSRRLQDDDTTSSFDLVVVVDFSEDGPDNLATDGGSSFCFAVLISSIVLLSVTLLT
jgi:hypothetical protein